MGKVEFPQGSATVFAEGNPVIRLGDPTEQNVGPPANAFGTVLAGAATVAAGG
jgi:uncharacterized Zn-binding protein involved in type VI secretion